LQVAYGHAGSLILAQAFEVLPKLCALVVFYPDKLQDPSTRALENVHLQVHLAGDQLFAPKYSHFDYPGTKPGFDQRDSRAYDKIASGLAWSRALGAVRRGFGIEVDLERIWERHLAGKFPLSF